MLSLICVSPLHLARMWPHVQPLLDPALAPDLADDDIETVRADLDAGRALLWIVWDGTLRAAVTTKIVDTPNKRLCVITACGGRGVRDWVGLVAEIERYAAAECCDAVRLTGRRGWKRFLPHYQEPWICLEKGLR